MRILKAVSLLAMPLIAGCDLEQQASIHIAVYPSSMSCAIGDKPLDCTKLGAYLRNELRALPDRDITVSYAGTENVLPQDKSIERIAERIRADGFANVRVVRYEF